MVAEEALGDAQTREYLRQQAVVVGGHVVVGAKYYGHQGLMAFQDYIQQGPKGVSQLCFVGGTATSVLGFMYVFNFFGSVVDPFHYILSAYMFAFGIATACIEADTDTIGMLIMPFDRLAEPITRMQAWLHEECKLLTTLRGRGLFYVYQGSLMITQCGFCLLFVAGFYNAFMGAICIMMSFGITPDIEGLVGAGRSEYGKIPSDEERSNYAGMAPPVQGHLVQGYASPSGSMAVPLASQVSNAVVNPANVAAELARGFDKARTACRENKDRLTGKTCRSLWAMEQQGMIGDCNEAKPSGMFNGNAKEQWRLWNGLKGIQPDDAKRMFIDLLLKQGVQI